MLNNARTKAMHYNPKAKTIYMKTLYTLIGSESRTTKNSQLKDKVSIWAVVVSVRPNPNCHFQNVM